MIQRHSQNNNQELITFQLKSENFGVDIRSVREIIKVPQITKIPRSPVYIKGVANLRGEVFPLIDTSLRFNLGEPEMTSSSRVLVLEVAGKIIGLIVDKISKVTYINKNSFESSSIVSGGINSEFIFGLYKSDESILMQINPNTVCDIHIADQIEHKAIIEKQNPITPKRENESLISFVLGNEEYAININSVKEIIRVSEMIKVPNSPKHIRGLISLKEKLLPVIDLRIKFGLKFQQVSKQNRIIILDLKNILIGLIVDKIKEIIRIPKSSIEPPPNIIADIEKDQLYGIAKVPPNHRLIMLLRPEKIISFEEIKNLEKADKLATTHISERVLSKSINKKHFVSLKLSKEEFCIDLQYVQEINRITNITKLPNTPPFIEGVINLRGSLFPLINLRNKFKIEKQSYGALFRIIIVDILGIKAGLMVDSVSEIFKIDSKLVEPLPDLVKTDVSMEYMSGVINLPSTGIHQRMLAILNLEKILSDAEKKAFENISISAILKKEKIIDVKIAEPIIEPAKIDLDIVSNPPLIKNDKQELFVDAKKIPNQTSNLLEEERVIESKQKKPVQPSSKHKLHLKRAR